MTRLFTSLAASLALASSGVLFSMADEGGAGAAAAPVTETKTVIKQNGIKRPDAGSVTGNLWDIADALSEAAGKPASRKDVVEKYMADVPGANQATANTQYARWVSFHGVSNILRDARAAETEARREAAKAEKEAAKLAANESKTKEAEEAAAAKAAKDAEKAAAKEAKDAEKVRKAEEKAAAKKAKDDAAVQAKADKDAAAAAAKTTEQTAK